MSVDTKDEIPKVTSFTKVGRKSTCTKIMEKV